MRRINCKILPWYCRGSWPWCYRDQTNLQLILLIFLSNQLIQGEQTMSNNCRRHYGFFNFVFDVFMTCLTAGFWLIWIFIREMRKQ